MELPPYQIHKRSKRVVQNGLDGTRRYLSPKQRTCYTLWTRSLQRRPTLHVSVPLRGPPGPADPESSISKNPSTFDWEANWYPILVATNANSLPMPYAFQILNKDLVLWQEEGGRWSVLEDRCPHRGARLSVGRVCKGALRCSYHGWEFATDGQLTNDPNLNDESKLQQCKVASYPVTESDGLIFVWPQATPDGWQASTQVNPPGLPRLDSPGTFHGLWVHTHRAFSAQLLLENALDPAHSAWVHEHSLPAHVIKNVVPMEVVEESIGPEGIVVKHGPYFTTQKGLQSTREFVAPCLTSIRQQFKGLDVQIAFYVTPTATSTAESFIRFDVSLPRNFAMKVVSSLLNAVVRVPLVQVWTHQSEIVDLQDNIVLSSTECALSSAGPVPNAYTMATEADGGIRAFYRWLKQYGGGKVPCSLPSGIESLGSSGENHVLSAKVLDKWQVHTRSCTVCRRMLGRLAAVCTWARRLSAMALAAGVLGMVVRRGPESSWLPLVCGVGVAVGCLLLGEWAQVAAHGFVSYRPRYGEPVVKLWKGMSTLG